MVDPRTAAAPMQKALETQRGEVVFDRHRWAAVHEAGHLVTHLFCGHDVLRAAIRTVSEMAEQRLGPPLSGDAARAARREGYVEATGLPFAAGTSKLQFEEHLREQGVVGPALDAWLPFGRALIEMDLVVLLAGPAAQAFHERRALDEVLREPSSASDLRMIHRLLDGWVEPDQREHVRAKMAGIADALVRSRRGRAFVTKAARFLLKDGEIGGGEAAALFEMVYGRSGPSWFDWTQYWIVAAPSRAEVRSGWLPPSTPKPQPKVAA